MLKFIYLIAFGMLAAVPVAAGQDITVDAGLKHQTIIGFGVNANPQSWNLNPAAVSGVLDNLIDSMGCTSFRLMFDDVDWEAENDNDDPEVYNWHYYDSIYSRPRFSGIWEMIRYLNRKGITDITLSPDGAAPKWMGTTKLLIGKEKEYAESIASMLIYARQRLSPAVQFNEISPINESSCGGGEGIVTTKDQFRLIYQSVAEHLDKAGVDSLWITGPDDCDGWKQNFEAMSESAVTMARVRYFGQHDYGDESTKARQLLAAVQKSSYPDRPVIMTEVNAVCVNCDGGVYNKDYGFTAYAKPAYKDILQDLNEGVAGVQVWEAYDSRYHHPNRTLTWSMWGIYAINDTLRPDRYTLRPHFDVLKQLYRFVKPGDHRISVSPAVPGMVITAFADSLNRKLIITGVSSNAAPGLLRLHLKNAASFTKLNLYSSDAGQSLKRESPLTVKDGMVTLLVAANSIFTLEGN